MQNVFVFTNEDVQNINKKLMAQQAELTDLAPLAVDSVRPPVSTAKPESPAERAPALNFSAEEINAYFVQALRIMQGC